MSTKLTLTALAAFAALGLAASAHAAGSSNDPDAVSVKVSIGDLNLGSTIGAKTALQRIRHAAKDICGEAPDPRAIEMGRQYAGCMDDTVNRAVASLDNPTVTALNGGHGQATTVLASNAR